MPRAKADHKVHLYQRVQRKNSVIWKCKKSGCTHFVYPDLLPGRICECYVCGNPFEITKKLMSQRTNIKCQDCRDNVPMDKRNKFKHPDIVEQEQKVEVNKNVIEDVIGDILGGLKL